jgi:chemotaxis signal transduction protein
MTLVPPQLDRLNVSRLKREFDSAFAKPAEARPILESFLGIGLRGDPYAIRLMQIEGLLTGRKIVPLPGPVPAFAGLAASRGVLFPVYDAGMLLGYPTAAPARWLVTVRLTGALVGLTFDRFDGHYRVGASDAPQAGTQSGPLSVVAGLPAARPVIDVLSLLDPILHLDGRQPTKGTIQP